MDYFKKFIADIKDFPKEGVIFKDITPLLGNPKAFARMIDYMAYIIEDEVDVLAALDARGFIFGGALALKLRMPLVIMRKKGKLPGETESVHYALEYNSATLEVHKDAFHKKPRVAVVDDLLATGGTAKAACELIEKLGGTVGLCIFAIELTGLGGRNTLDKYPVVSMVTY